MTWRQFPSMDSPGDDVAWLDYGKAWIPEEDAIELGKKYAEKWGHAGFVVVPEWQKLFWKGSITKLIPERPGFCHSWISYCSDCSGTRLASTQNLEPHRPVFHFTPGKMWMNDPNGMFYKDGEFHLYYQHNPFKNSMGPMHWGHATTSDLLHWRRQPVALFPDNLGCIFSGSCVVDAENTFGFGNGAVVAFFTHHREDRQESQSIAYSVDGGMTFDKFPDNPVIPREENFRDPKVLWDTISKRWIMAVASPQAKNSIRFYGNGGGDVTDWKFLSAFPAGTGATDGKWECPELLYFADHKCHLLIVSVKTGGPNGGSGTQYFIGRWEDEAFKCDLPLAAGEPLWLDHGPDNYDGVTWSNHGDGTYHRMIGWMSNWKYAPCAPTKTWRSAMTLPRDLRLIETPRGLRLITTLPPEVIDFFQEPANPDESTILVGLFKFDVKTDAMHSTVIEFSSAAGDILAVTCDASHSRISIDRSGCGAFDFVRGDEQMPPTSLIAPWHASPEKPDSVTIVLDRASIELFADGGQTVMTATFFPQSDLNKVVVKGVAADMIYFPYVCIGEDGTDDVASRQSKIAKCAG